MVRPSIEAEIKAAMPRLRRFAFALAGGEDGEDLAQATLERALGRIHLYEPGTRIDSWLFRIAQNLHHNSRRAAARRETATDPVTLAETAAGAGGGQEARLLLARVSAAIDALPPEQRAALAAIAIDGESYAEAAAKLGQEPGTVASRVSRARQTLRKLLSDEDK